ncbi:MAG TPA: GNAT family N-acetyltransferase [Casimicrobiaceae bacterium]|nr:GNAT family N-acetyltransferase [Casimicrobiaceae bacterium]
MPRNDSHAALAIRHDVPIERIAAAQWDPIAQSQPFLTHAFLSALHETGCASRATGWTPRFVTAWRNGSLEGALPLYAKTHSYGEYVFDWGWADAYRRYGRRYYPKLVGAIPFTPVTGPRLLASDDSVKEALRAAAADLVARKEVSSLHLLFLDERDAALCTSAGMTIRTGVQFHWMNAGYRDFDDFLSRFSHDKRKKVKQDRRRVRDAGITFARKTGSDISAADWAFFYRCYEATYRAHHSTPYLTLAFFNRVAQTLGDHILMVVGIREGRPICAALDVFDAASLWGRYWGSVDYVPGLHFEACYYQAIDFCIERRIASFEGGAQGMHKLARGLQAVVTHSAHYIGEPAFAAAIDDYCARERVDIAHTVDELAHGSPFRRALTADDK